MKLDTPHVFTPEEGLLTTGQPSHEDFATLATQGFSTVINLRSAQEMQGSDEHTHVQSLGMTYVHIPIAGPDGVTLGHARALHQAMAQASEGKLLIHCGSSNRVGALLALRAHDIQGHTIADALAYGERAGLASLKARVEQVLAQT